MRRFGSALLLPFFLLAIITVVFFLFPDFDFNARISPLPTTYSKNQKGMNGLFLVLKSLKKDTRRWNRPFPLLKSQEIGTLITVDPQKPLSPREKEALDLWFSKGGQMFFLHDGDWDVMETGYHQNQQSFKETFKDHPNLLSVKDWTFLTNQELRNAPENSVSLIQQIFSHSGPVYFDEYHLGTAQTKNLRTIIKEFSNHPVGWTSIHVMIVFFLYLLSTPNSELIDDEKKEINKDMIEARASFLKHAQAKEFANQLISKYRKNHHDTY